MKFKKVLTWDKSQRKLRLFRVFRTKGTLVNDGGYSECLQVALMPKLFGFYKSFCDYRLVLFGVSLHYKRSYGGIFA